jgi:tetratricopeptide (TPR) repeat protein
LTIELEQPRHYSDTIPGSAPDPEFALAEAERRASHPHADPRSVALAQLRAVEGRLAEGRSRDAIEIARRAVSLLEEKAPNDRPIYAAALSALSRAEQEDGDLIAALQHTETEIRLRRQATNDARNSPETVRHLSFALTRLGDLRRQIGEWDEARSAYEQALKVDRESLKAYGESPQTLRDLYISLNNVGDVHQQAGELAEARAAYEESLRIARRLLQAYGESPQTLRDLSVSLSNVGDVRRQAGELAEARAAYEESLGIDRRLLKAYGESPQALNDLAISLRKVADIRRELGDETLAKKLHHELEKLRAKSSGTRTANGQNADLRAVEKHGLHQLVAKLRRFFSRVANAG